MRIGTSIVIMAIGAVMAFAVEVDRAEGFNINTAGIILIVAGAIGLVASLVMFSSPRRTVVDGPEGRTVYHDSV
jgi:hypothetical protein